ncbi:hypothetical protein [Psychroserpens sp. Hel_I_66]|uniref:hypothetical protein n=1 Tax=Psychroserpens sp. Hel_I_66 TaxID=1250004 RepID=UPI0006457552|nr:hypothetical protein [Psychroserpens sp. Hel_I_66]
MKDVIFNIYNHDIVFKTNWLGIETVVINGKQISKKLSLPYRKHKFTIEAYGKTESFYIKTKQAFSSGAVTVKLFHNDVLIDEGFIAFEFTNNTHIKEKSNDDLFMTGLVLVVFSMVFDWSKFFLFIGLMCLFSSFFNTTCQKDEDKDSNKLTIKKNDK